MTLDKSYLDPAKVSDYVVSSVAAVKGLAVHLTDEREASALRVVGLNKDLHACVDGRKIDQANNVSNAWWATYGWAVGAGGATLLIAGLEILGFWAAGKLK